MAVLRGIVHPPGGAQAHHGGLDVEILFRSFVYRLQSGLVPRAHSGVHLLEHDKYQVSGAHAELITGPRSAAVLALSLWFGGTKRDGLR